MSSNPDPSSAAAQGAQPDEDDSPDQRPGFLARLFGATSPDQTDEANGSAVAGADLRPFGMSNLRHMRVEDVAIPRAEIVSASCDVSLSELVAIFRESGMTRLPVYDGTLDVPVGLVHLKDVALRYGFDKTNGSFSLRTMLRPLLYVPPSMPLVVLLHQDAVANVSHHGAGHRRIRRRRGPGDYRGPDRAGGGRDRGRARHRREADL
jgi:magnesium and cobalt transporter